MESIHYYNSDIMVVKKWKRAVLIGTLSFFILINYCAFINAYKSTHFTHENSVADKISGFGDVIKAAFLGVNIPKPINKVFPKRPYEIIRLKSNVMIECWKMNTENAKGTVIIFHGYIGQKSSMLGQAEEFIKQSYNTILVDFMGSGGSEGYTTTIGYYESENVKTVFDYLRNTGEQNIVLFGTSLGAAAIMKAISDYGIKPSAVILECPFGSMHITTAARFSIMKSASLPFSAIVLFWGSIINDFWAFKHNPSEYARKINCPTLLYYGELDKNVSRQETNDIYSNLNGKKMLVTFPNAGHENYLNKYKQEWIKSTTRFLEENINF